MRPTWVNFEVSRLKPKNQGLAGYAGLASAIAWALASTASVAAEPKLNLVSGGPTAATSKSVRVKQLQFVPSTKTLVVQTRAGNYGCGTPGALVTGDYRMTLDGVTYPLHTASASLPTGFDPDLNGTSDPMLYMSGTGLVSVAPVGALSTDCVSSHSYPAAATGEHYDLIFDGQQALDVAEAIYYNLGDRTFEIRVADPVLCTSYGTGKLSIALADPNNPDWAAAPQVLAGFQTVDFVPGTLSLQTLSSRPPASQAPFVQCSTPGALTAPSGTTLLFGSGFELAEGSAEVDLKILIDGNPASAFKQTQGAQLELVVRVANTGTLPARNVRIREYAPLAGAYGAGLADIRVAGTGSDYCFITGTSTRCDSAGGAGLAFPLSFDIETLAPGESRDFVLHRSPVEGAAGQSAQVGFAAFVDPALTQTTGPDLKLSDNASWASFAVS